MKNHFTILSAAALLLGLGGCSREPEIPAASRITISPAITRVAGLNFEPGDQIGLTITRTSDVYADNVMMSYDGGVFAGSELVWYETNDASTLTAYYPYVQSGAPVQFDVAADQSADCETSDLLVAVKEKVTPSTAAVGMVFRHMMSVVNISVKNNTTSPVAEVRVGGTKLSADVDLAAQTATVKSSGVATDIKAFALTSGSLYKAIVVPQSAVLVLTVKTSDGNTLSRTLAENTLLQGKSYTIEATVEKDKLVLSLSGEVSDWEPGGALKPGVDPEVPEEPGGSGNEGEPETPGNGETMECMGTVYKTTTIGTRVWMAENLRYKPDGVMLDPGTWYPNGDGTDNNIKAYGMLYDNETAVRLCPEGWRLPTEEDFTALIAELQPPYEAFVLLSGTYSFEFNSYNSFGRFGYLAGSTEGVREDTKKYLLYEKSRTIKILEGFASASGVGVRYVKDVQ